MPTNISEVFSNFNKKLKRFNSADESDRAVIKNKSSVTFTTQAEEREEKLRMSVVANYRIYRSPFETLGTDSERAASVDRDEQFLLKAYNLYKSAMDLNVMNQDEIGSTYINDVEIFSPLGSKAVYTNGGQFIYLCAWLWFEQNSKEYRPFFNSSKHNLLKFVKSQKFEFENHDKEIFNIIEAEFYS